MNEKAKWTFMVYLAGDNNLSTAGEKDLGEMSTVGSTADVNIVAEFDRIGNGHRTKRYHVQQGDANEVADLGETDSGDPNVLLDFIDWTACNYPAERYALVLWNHGSGWKPSDIDSIATEVKTKDYNQREAGERSASPLGKIFFRTTMKTIFSLPTAGERAICEDDGTGHSLDTTELGKVLKKAVDRLGQPIDLLGMDACLMSNLGVAYQVRPYAQYMVASEELEPGDGWPYDAVLGELVVGPNMATADLAAHIVKAYVKSYVDENYPDPITQSALNLAKVGELAAPIDDLADALIDALPAVRSKIWEAQFNSVRFCHNTLWDISHFCEELEKLTANTPVASKAGAVRTALQPGAEEVVIAEAHNGAKVARCAGATIYLPAWNISRFYPDLNYAQDHRWLKMLEAYHPSS